MQARHGAEIRLLHGHGHALATQFYLFQLDESERLNDP